MLSTPQKSPEKASPQNSEPAGIFGPHAQPELVWQGKPRHVTASRAFVNPVESHPPANQHPHGKGANGPTWKNRLIQGDNREVLTELLQGPINKEIKACGGLKLIYVDPPFLSGGEFQFNIPVGSPAATEKQEIIKALAYQDSWGGHGEEYLTLMYESLFLMHKLLADDGAIYVHCDYRAQAQLRLILDELFGKENFINEIVWHYYNKYSTASRCLPRAHDSILVYSKTGKHTFTPPRFPRPEPRKQLLRKMVDGVLKNARDMDGKLMYRTATDKKGDDVWTIPQLQPASSEWSGFTTQKHHALLERILKMGSREGDLVADFFCGSGTTLATAQRLGRKWIGCDQGHFALFSARKRILKARGEATSKGMDVPAFEILKPDITPGFLLADPPEIKVKTEIKGNSVQVKLLDFKLPPGSSMPAGTLPLQNGGGQLALEKGQLVKYTKDGTRTNLTRKNLDWVDGWAVSFNPATNTPFQPDWVSHRDWHHRKLEKISPAHIWPTKNPGSITIQIQDIFGNTWTQHITT